MRPFQDAALVSGRPGFPGNSLSEAGNNEQESQSQGGGGNKPGLSGWELESCGEKKANRIILRRASVPGGTLALSAEGHVRQVEGTEQGHDTICSGHVRRGRGGLGSRHPSHPSLALSKWWLPFI